MNTIPEQAAGGRLRRRVHSDDFKANAVAIASCMQPGMSMAAVAMAHSINANLLRRWVHEAETRHGADPLRALPAPKPLVKAAAFVPMQLPAPSVAPDIHIELRRGTTAITVSWLTQAAAACAAWMRELL